MALDDDIRILSGVSFLEGFTTDQLRLLAFGAERLSLAAGADLYREGAPADCAFVVIEGAVELFTVADGERVPMGRARPGSFMGELALVADTRRPTHAAAATACRLLRIARKDFRRVLEEYPDLAVALHKRVTEDFQTLVDRIERLAPRFS